MRNKDMIEGIAFLIFGIITLIFGFILASGPKGVYLSYFVLPGIFFIISFFRIIEAIKKNKKPDPQLRLTQWQVPLSRYTQKLRRRCTKCGRPLSFDVSICPYCGYKQIK